MRADARGFVSYVRGRRQHPSDRYHVSAVIRTAKTSPTSWDAFSDVDAFVDEVLTELAAMKGTKLTWSGLELALAEAALRRTIMAVWGVCASAT
jgi:hypothetical protein